jgi:hypothetical protein
LVPKTYEIPVIKIRSNFSIKGMNFYSDDDDDDSSGGGGDDDDSTVECQLSEALPVKKKRLPFSQLVVTMLKYHLAQH